MDAKDILKTILDRQGMITIKETDLDQSKDKTIAVIETWDDDGNKIFTIYTHQARKK
jgi:hypothetical protein